ncbi:MULTISPECIES: Gfo/Idh/MocA family protein [Rhodococcus]|uniref:Putative oxidoreductase n=1 Tax=Rhodococcus wratislaviensis NBRC 100605 TaxID=1219028 RepID=X0PJ52_RHOWR|nr:MULTISPECIES: Gfo/Idh/MocA family oxidoreductase [Rhodococcus]WAM12903.1 Gfo/Idh/MocA family oxidoreductase [Rhodococcus sp. JS3073]GAF42183.1 putative oxidoreductase [Rhodococcus wratislaviensis NBRC 100605]
MRWAILGASNIAATRVIPALRECGQTAAVVLSGDAARAEDYRRTHDIEAATGDLHDAVGGNVQAAYISSTNDKHFDHAMAAIDAGLHVLCEKPLSFDVTQAQKMVDAAAAAGVVFATNHHLRNHPVHRAARKMLAEGAIGDILSVRVSNAILLRQALRGWRLDGVGGGVALDLAVHDLDTLRFVTGMEPTTVTAVGVCQGLSEGPADAVMTSGVLGSSTLFSLHDAYTVPGAVTGFEIHGTTGTLVAGDCMRPDPTGTLRIVADGQDTTVPLEPVDNLYAPGIRAFVDAVNGDGEPVATGHDGLRSVTAALAVLQSIDEGRTVRL